MYHTRHGHPEHCEFTVVKTDFYNDIAAYLSRLRSNPHSIRSLEDIVAYNKTHTATEGGVPGTHPAWPVGQDSFDMSCASKGVQDKTYWSALEYIRLKAREEGIDAAMGDGDEEGKLDALLVPCQAEGEVSWQVVAKAGTYLPVRVV